MTWVSSQTFLASNLANVLSPTWDRHYICLILPLHNLWLGWQNHGRVESIWHISLADWRTPLHTTQDLSLCSQLGMNCYAPFASECVKARSQNLLRGTSRRKCLQSWWIYSGHKITHAYPAYPILQSPYQLQRVGVKNDWQDSISMMTDWAPTTSKTNNLLYFKGLQDFADQCIKIQWNKTWFLWNKTWFLYFLLHPKKWDLDLADVLVIGLKLALKIIKQFQAVVRDGAQILIGEVTGLLGWDVKSAIGALPVFLLGDSSMNGIPA